MTEVRAPSAAGRSSAGPPEAAPPALATPPARVVPGSVGILGGTFDPIHHGHLAIAEEVRERLGLERVVFVPARVPPHRPAAPGASAEDRYAMVGLAVADNPAFSVSRLELDRPGPSYSVDTVAALVDAARAAGREADLWFIASTEAVRALPTWREPERLLAMARFAVVPRAGSEPLDEAWLADRLPIAVGRLALLDGPLLPISGTAIRARAAVDRSLRYLVPDTVARYIGDHRLYRRESPPPPGPAQETHRP